MPDISNEELFERIATRLDASDRKSEDRMTALENQFRGLTRLFQQVLDEVASFRGMYNRHRHGPPE